MDMKKKRYQKPLAVLFCIDEDVELMAGSDNQGPKGSSVYNNEESDSSTPALAKSHSVWDEDDED